MKRKNRLIGVMAVSLMLAGCSSDHYDKPIATKIFDSYLGWFIFPGVPIVLDEFPDVTFTRSVAYYALLANDEIITLPDNTEVASFGCMSFYVADFNHDGYRELCFGCSLGSGYVNENITILDYHNQKILLTLGERFVNDCYFYLDGEELKVKETEPMQQEEVTRTGSLVYRDAAVAVIWDEIAS